MRKETMQGFALLIAMVVVGILTFPIFKAIDCYNAERFIETYETCQLDENCSLPPWVSPRAYEREHWNLHNFCSKD